MESKLLLLGALALILFAISCRSIVKIMEPKLLFYPSPGLALSPAFFGMEFRNAVMESGDFRIHGWFMPEKKNDLYLIFYHGNAGNMADRLDFAQVIKTFNVNLLMIDYKGYGRSEGYPTLNGLEEDAIAAVDWLKKRYNANPSRIILWGRSLGVAAAMAAAERHPDIGGVILESGFVSLRRIAQDLYPIIPVALVSDSLDSGTRVAKSTSPKLIIHGMQDDLIPFSHAEELYARAAEPKQAMPIKSAGHNDTAHVGGQEYLRLIGEWVESIRGSTERSP